MVLETRELNVFRVKPNLVKGSGSNRVQLDIPLPTLKLYKTPGVTPGVSTKGERERTREGK